jgi:L-alanine-DL-glutamate epimerase-like enolase superfamily enzyme
MIVKRVEVLRSKHPVPLPVPWRAAWCEPYGPPVSGFSFSMYKLTTDEGLVGIGPTTGASPSLALGVDPFRVGEFWAQHMSGRRAGTAGKGASGLEIALWDIVGKASHQPLAHLLGARRDRLTVYAATSRLLTIEAHIQQVEALIDQGFRAIKLRLHRPDPREDLAVVAAVRDAVGTHVTLLVDANQNNASEGYRFWGRQTALWMARELEALGVYFLEEPLPRSDTEGLREVAASVAMYIAGGEHTPTVYDWREHVTRGAYDILQPDLVMGGNLGITGARKLADYADLHGRLIIPHVLLSQANLPLTLAPTLHTMAAVDNCPMVEYPYDPPVLTEETTQSFALEPLSVASDGTVKVPQGPGLGIDIDEADLIQESVVEL